jgi:pantetheine-phosphate adenylyltransferase
MNDSVVAVYPGSFDPITNGHLNIIERGIRAFGKVTVAVARNMSKAPLFTVEERMAQIVTAVGDEPRVEVESFDGLLVNYAGEKGASVVLRGLRALSDFEYEFQMAHMNRKMAPHIETVFMMAGEEHFYISSGLVKEIVSLGGDVSAHVPPNVLAALKQHY